MNRIIIIGNGFDLAHGLRTSYTDFIVSYLKKTISESYNKDFYDDSLLNIKNRTKFTNGDADLNKLLDGFNSIEEVFNHWHVSHNVPAIQRKSTSGTKTDLFKVEIKSEFLKRLFVIESLNNWVDIETEYYKLLIDLIALSPSKERDERVKKLNSDLEVISKKLREHLLDVEGTLEHLLNKATSEFTTKMIELIYPRQIYSSGNLKDKFSSMIVNYNYTSTIKWYLDKNPYDYQVELLNIHGSVGKEDDFIFGYGHVPDERYKLTENYGENAQKNLKMFNYFNSNSFSRMVSFIDNEQFEIVVLGHSCGESDGSTLSRLFNHKNCQRISITYYKKDEFQPKLMQITKHCPEPDERIFKLIRPFNQDLFIPQNTVE